MTFDSTSMVENTLIKVEIPNNANETFDSSNIKTIYDRTRPELSTAEALKEAQEYISFTSFSQQAMQGEVKSYFYGKGQDANAYFEARLQAKNTQGVNVIDLRSPVEKVEIR